MKIKFFFIKILFFIQIFFSSFNLYSQNQSNQWYFGNGAGLDFHTAPPLVVNGNLHTAEGTATICGINGNLLFYTDGDTIWNRNHIPMPNGTNLMGNWSSTQSALIVPFSDDSLKYYVFTMQDMSANGDLRYSIIDMALDNGNGDIVTSSKNILLASNFTEKLVSAKGSCGVWVITHKRNNNSFYSYLINADGISSPVISNVGSVHTSTGNPSALTGTMKVSSNSQKIALATLTGIVELFDFNASTGVVSNVKSIGVSANAQGYGVCFSPDNKKLYVGEGFSASSIFNSVFQYDLSSDNIDTIKASKYLVGYPTTPLIIVFDMQIAPDNKIYISRSGTKYLDAIETPNVLGSGCNYISNAVDFGSPILRAGLPNAVNFSSDNLPVNLINNTTICQGDSVVFSLDGATSYLWSTGSTDSSITVTTEGTLWVQASKGDCIVTDSVVVTVKQYPEINLGNDTTLCQGQTKVLDAGLASSYQWSNGLTSSNINVTSSGTYWVQASNGQCNDRDTINVTFNPNPIVNLGKDTTLCEGQQLILNGGTQVSYLWSNGSTDSLILVSDTGLYSILVGNGQCFSSDSIAVKYNKYPAVELGSDTTICEGASLILNAGTGYSYLWPNNETDSVFIVSMPGKYWVEVFNGNCLSTDTIIVLNENCEIEIALEMPNVFTPNGDGKNDVFLPNKYSGIESGTLQIFNRWGKELYNTDNIQDGWNGYYNDKICPEGTYFWIINCSTVTNESKVSRGNLTLIQ